MNVIVTSITANQALWKWTLGKSQESIQTAEVRGWNRGRNNILVLYDLYGLEYNFIDKPQEKKGLYEGHAH